MKSRIKILILIVFIVLVFCIAVPISILIAIINPLILKKLFSKYVISLYLIKWIVEIQNKL